MIKHSVIKKALSAFVAVVLLAAAAYVPPTGAAAGDIIVYDGTRNDNHLAGSYGGIQITTQSGDKLPDGELFGGTPSYLFEATGSSEGGAYANFYTDGGYNLEPLYNDGGLRFHLKGAEGGETFTAKLFTNTGGYWETTAVSVTATDAWQEIDIPFSQFTSAANSGRLYDLQLSFGFHGLSGKTFSLTNIYFYEGDPPGGATANPSLLPDISISGNSGSWGSDGLSFSMTVTDSTYNGSNAVSFAATPGTPGQPSYWGGLLAVSTWSPTDITDYRQTGSVEFFAKGAVGGERFQLSLQDNQSPDSQSTSSVTVTLQSDEWHRISVPLDHFSLNSFSEEQFIRASFFNDHDQPLQFWLHSIKITWRTIDDTIVAAAPPIEAETSLGTAPVLPDTMEVEHIGGASSELKVYWEQPHVSQYGQFGPFTLQGSFAETELTTTATINVVYTLFKDSKPVHAGGSGANLLLVTEPDETLPLDSGHPYGLLPSLKLEVASRDGDPWGWWYANFPLDSGYAPRDIQALYEHGSLTFAVKGAVGGESFNLQLYNSATDTSFTAVPLMRAISASQDWQRVSIPLRRMVGSAADLSAISVLSLNNQLGTPFTVWISDMKFVSATERYIYSYQPVSLRMTVGGELRLPTTVQANYNDGTSAELPVDWHNAGAVDTATAGVYTVHGTVQGSSLTAIARVNVQRKSSGETPVDPFAALNPGNIVYDGEPIAAPHVPELSELIPNGSGGAYVIDASRASVVGGMAVIEPGEAEVRQALEQLRQHAAGQSGTLVIQSGQQQADGYEVKLPTLLFSPANAGLSIALRTPGADIIIPGGMFSQAELAGSGEVSVGVRFVWASELPAGSAVGAHIGDRPVLELFAAIGGERIAWSNEQAPVTVAVNYELTDEEWNDPGRLVVVYVDGNGVAEPLADSYFDRMRGRVVFHTAHFSYYALSYATPAFADLDNHDWARKAVYALAARGIVNGTSPTAFAPGETVSRADFILMLVRTLGLTGAATDNFADVAPSSYYYEAVGLAKQLGIASGSGGNTFRPGDSISRQDMFALTARALRASQAVRLNEAALPDGRFADEDSIAEYVRTDIAALAEAGLIAGFDGRLNPNGRMTRAEAAVMMNRMYWMSLDQ